MTGKIAVIGLGNPVLTDDSVGIKVARALAETIRNRDGVDFLEVAAGGLRLMDAMIGYQRVVIIDAMETGMLPAGTIRRLLPGDGVSTKNTASSRDASFAATIELGRRLGLRLPEEISIWGIEAADVDSFGVELTEDVARAVPWVVDEITRELAAVLTDEAAGIARAGREPEGDTSPALMVALASEGSGRC